MKRHALLVLLGLCIALTGCQNKADGEKSDAQRESRVPIVSEDFEGALSDWYATGWGTGHWEISQDNPYSGNNCLHLWGNIHDEANPQVIYITGWAMRHADNFPVEDGKDYYFMTGEDLTTQAGLCTALPVLFFHHIIGSRLRLLANEIEVLSHLMHQGRAADHPRPDDPRPPTDRPPRHNHIGGH